ncbi:hypothetical protein F5Y15DRAFT_419610 [Xylariaceae sp. FL0016]|nr:hypothetical protein F5Y15DRAFT_419610 [Xylariaceae sp. FL0016]
MDPVTILSVAAATVQFLDFGTRLLIATSELYNSSEGQLKDGVELSKVCEDFESLTGNIKSKLSQTGPQIAQRGETRLALAANSFKVALRGLLSGAKIESIQRRLGEIRSQIVLAVQILSWEQSNQIAAQQVQHMDKLQSIDDATRSLNKTFADYVQDFSQKIHPENRYVFVYLTSSGFDPGQAIEHMALDNRIASSETKKEIATKCLIDSLQFDSMNKRAEAVPKAYQDTFEWVFGNPYASENGAPAWANFGEWLSKDSSELYWIVGKPGSGKSTLMKFILADARLKTGLNEWADEGNLVTATYFSWNAGTIFQKSQPGLLRALLYQCLSHSKVLVSNIFPGRWNAFWLPRSDSSIYKAPEWTMEELLSGFRRFLECTKSQEESKVSFKLGIFIDGLDEFEDNHLPLVKLLQEASTYDNVKVCVSSRPWNVFRDALKPMLRLQDLTCRDIRLFVDKKFQMSPAFGERKMIQPKQAAKLLEDIISKADGAGDSLSDFQNTLEGLPDDLSALFDVMWERLEPRHRSEAARLFAVVDAYYLLHKFIIAIWLGEEKLSLDVNPVFRHNLMLLSVTLFMSRRVSSRTNGMLETNDLDGLTDGEIEYMHRTARDWRTSSDPISPNAKWDGRASGGGEFETQEGVSHAQTEAACCQQVSSQAAVVAPLQPSDP